LPPSCFSNTQDPVEQPYGDINFNTVTAQQLKGRAMLSVTNEDYLELNVSDRMPGEETVYKSVDTVASQEPSDHLVYPEEFLNSLIPTGMPPHELKLKVAAVIMLLRNLMPSWGLCNGTRLTITSLQRHIIEARVIDRLNMDTLLILRIPLIPYLLTPWSRVLLEKLRVSSASQEIPCILRNPKAHHRVHKSSPLSLSRAK
jgi:ATP-dependent DNA helicase PIF1